MLSHYHLSQAFAARQLVTPFTLSYKVDLHCSNSVASVVLCSQWVGCIPDVQVSHAGNGQQKKTVAGLVVPQRPPAQPVSDSSVTSLHKQKKSEGATSTFHDSKTSTKAAQQKPCHRKAASVPKRKRGEDTESDLDRAEQQPVKKQNVKTSDSLVLQQSVRQRKSSRGSTAVNYCEDDTVMLDAPVPVARKRKGAKGSSIKPPWR